jgi:A/G-specific adenine glycosylase
VKLSAKDLPEFRQRLLAWFSHRKRDLPWRRTGDPYRIWLAEVMLQQTRVAVVLPYYRRFLRRFPSLAALARARAEQVLRRWAGLGYYSRARNLLRAAKVLRARHRGRFPRQMEAALRLPGIGRYTAAAVLSMAYGASCAVLDGNVARVLARLEALRGDLRAPRRWRQLQGLAENFLAHEAPGDWNQAMMELGATVCTPGAPRCTACPVSPWCRAYRLGIARSLPTARKKRSPVRVQIAAAVLLDARGRTLVVKDTDGRDGALFSRMWQFPALEVSPLQKDELARHLRPLFGRDYGELLSLPPARHTVTFRDITLTPYLVRVTRLPKVRGVRTPLLAKLDRLPISNATRKIAVIALRHASGRPPDREDAGTP